MSTCGRRPWLEWLTRRATSLLVVGCLPAWFALRSVGWGSLLASAAVLTLCAGVLVLLEATARRGETGERPRGTVLIDVGYNVLSATLNAALPILVFIPLLSGVGPVYRGTPLWPQDLPVAVDIVLCLVLIDFTSYWWHRLEHESWVPALWRVHSVHHAPRYFDFLAGAHVHPLDIVVFTAVTSGVASLLGVPAVTLEASMLFAAVIGAMHHLDARTDLGWLNRLLPFADHHVMHHSVDPTHNGNFGNITTLFDQIFGTFIPPRPEGEISVGAWSLASDYPHTSFAFQLLSIVSPWWQRANAASSAASKSKICPPGALLSERQSAF